MVRTNVESFTCPLIKPKSHPLLSPSLSLRVPWSTQVTDRTGRGGAGGEAEESWMDRLKGEEPGMILTSCPVAILCLQVKATVLPCSSQQSPLGSHMTGRGLVDGLVQVGSDLRDSPGRQPNEGEDQRGKEERKGATSTGGRREESTPWRGVSEEGKADRGGRGNWNTKGGLC